MTIDALGQPPSISVTSYPHLRTMTPIHTSSRTTGVVISATPSQKLIPFKMPFSKAIRRDEGVTNQGAIPAPNIREIQSQSMAGGQRASHKWKPSGAGLYGACKIASARELRPSTRSCVSDRDYLGQEREAPDQRIRPGHQLMCWEGHTSAGPILALTVELAYVTAAGEHQRRLRLANFSMPQRMGILRACF
jgi:hypothetical protein